MSVDDLKKAQAAGWMVEGALEDGILCRCPSHGCGLRVKIKYGAPIQQCDPGLSRHPADRPIGSYEEVRQLLRERREDLLLSIPEVEEIAGLTKDHLAKAEKDNPSRLPELDTILVWAQALGFEMVLRPTPLSNMGLRLIDETGRYRSRRVRARDRRRRARQE